MDHYLALGRPLIMSNSRYSFMSYLPRAAMGLSVLGVISVPASLVLDQGWLLAASWLVLVMGVLCALVYGLTTPSAAASVVLWCMVLYLVAMLFKILHYPGAAFLMMLAFGVPILLFLVGTLALPFRYEGNVFLILIGGVAGLVLIAGYFASLSKMMYWSNGDLLFKWFAPGYVVVTMLLLVGIQLTDFVQWDPAPRRYLTNNILLPWAFLFLVGGSILLLPKDYFNLVRGNTDWGMVEEALEGS